MRKQGFSNYFISAAGLLACAVLGMKMVSTVWAEDQLPEMSSDGLQLVKHSKVKVAYLKPGVTLDKYSRVKILDCFVQFRKNWERDYNMNELGLDGRVTDKEAADIQANLAAEFKKVFTEVLTKGGHEIVDETGDDVLLLRPAIINLDVTAPDIPTAGISTTYVASAGQMTLYMEMYDSATNTLISRVVDPEAGGTGGIAMAANRVTNRAEADQILNRWAKLLNGHLATMKEIKATP